MVAARGPTLASSAAGGGPGMDGASGERMVQAMDLQWTGESLALRPAATERRKWGLAGGGGDWGDAEELRWKASGRGKEVEELVGEGEKTLGS